jgi:outer membrane beta-barrel protein
LALSIALALGTSVTAAADEKEKDREEEGEEEAAQWEESDDLPSVQNRLYRTEIELNGGVGVLPVDPYVKGVTFNGGAAWHFNDIWAVEGRFHYLLNLPTSLRDQLENQFGIPPTRFAEVMMYGTVGGLFKPIYGKLSFLNKTLVYGEFYLSLAGVVARMNGGKKTEEEPDGKGKRIAFGGAPGFGIRGYFFTWLSVRLDFRWLMLYSRGEGHYPMALSLSFGLTTRSDL